MSARSMGSDAAVAVGRFDPAGVHGYRARTAPGAPLRATRAEAVEDERAFYERQQGISAPYAPLVSTRTVYWRPGSSVERVTLYCPNGHECVDANATSRTGARILAGDYSNESCGCGWNGADQ